MDVGAIPTLQFQVHVTSHGSSIPLPRGPLVLPSDYVVDVPGSDSGVVVRVPQSRAGGRALTHLVRVRAANRNGWGPYSQFFALPA